MLSSVSPYKRRVLKLGGLTFAYITVSLLVSFSVLMHVIDDVPAWSTERLVWCILWGIVYAINYIVSIKIFDRRCKEIASEYYG